MKIFLRILVILAAALVVAGVAFGAAQISGLGGQNAQPQGFAERGGPQAGGSPDGGHHEDGGGLSGLADLGQNLLNVGWIVLAVVIVTRGWKMLQGYLRRQKLRPTPTI